MEEKILKYRKKIIGAIAFGLITSLAIGTVGFIQPMPATAQEDNDVSVSAAVNAWLNFSVGTTLDLGELVTASGDAQLGTANVTMTVGTNNRDGWSIEMIGSNDGSNPPANGTANTGDSFLYGTTAEYAIPSISERGSISAGGDLYGALVEPLKSEGDWTEEDTPNGEPTITPEGDDTEGSETGYVWEETTGTEADEEGQAGPIPYDAGAKIVSADLPHSETDVANFHIRAAAGTMTPSDDYTDTITLTASGGV